MRKQKPVSYNANNPISEKLQLGFVYRELYFRLHGEVNITAAGTAGSAPESPEAIIKRLELVIDGNTRLRVTDGPALAQLQHVFFGTAGERTTVDPTTTGAQTFSSYMVLPLWIPHSLRPIDTAVDSSQFSSFEVVVTWGSVSDIAGDATATFSVNPELQIRSLESFGVTPPGNQWRTYTVKQNIAAANTAFQIPLTIGNMYRGFQIRTRAGNPAAPVDTVLNNLKLVSGSTVYFDLSADDLKNINIVRKNMDSAQAGYYFIDMVTDGYMTEAIDTLGFSEIFLEADVNAPSGAVIEVFPQEFIPVRGNASGG